MAAFNRQSRLALNDLYYDWFLSSNKKFKSRTNRINMLTPACTTDSTKVTEGAFVYAVTAA